MPATENRPTARLNKYKTNDRRVQKTKKGLRNALFELIKQKDIKDISVTELTQTAEINRSTFYFYYKDIYDMMEQIQNEIYSVIDTKLIQTDLKFNKLSDYTSYIQRFLEFGMENSEICKFVIINDCQNKLAKKILDSLLENVPDSKLKYEPTDSRYYLTVFAINAIQGSVIEWLNDGMKVPANEMAAFLSMTYVLGSVRMKNKDFFIDENK